MAGRLREEMDGQDATCAVHWMVAREVRPSADASVTPLRCSSQTTPFLCPTLPRPKDRGNVKGKERVCDEGGRKGLRPEGRPRCPRRARSISKDQALQRIDSAQRKESKNAIDGAPGPEEMMRASGLRPHGLEAVLRCGAGPWAATSKGQSPRP